MSARHSIELYNQTGKTASDTGGAMQVDTLTMLHVGAIYTRNSGTTDVVSVFLQWSPDKTNWFDLYSDKSDVNDTGTGEVTADINDRNIVSAVSASTTASALYEALAAYWVRVRIIATGTVNYDLKVLASGK